MRNLTLMIFMAALVRANAGAGEPAAAPPAETPATAVSSAGAAAVPEKPAAPQACECRRCMAVYGDSRSNHDIHARIAALIKARNPLAIFHMGDMVSSGGRKKDWEKFREITRGLRESASFYAVLGNHEAGGEKTFNDVFHYPGNGRWYSAELSGVRFLMLDYLSPLEKGSGQFKWLEERLRSPMNAARFTVIVVHKPLISSGWHWNEKWKAAKDLAPLYEKYKVSMVLSGHDHGYERLEKDGIVYIVTGGGGAELRPLDSRSRYSRIFAEAYNYCLLSVCGDTLKVEAFDLNDRLIDTFEIQAGPAGREIRNQKNQRKNQGQRPIFNGGK